MTSAKENAIIILEIVKKESRLKTFMKFLKNLLKLFKFLQVKEVEGTQPTKEPVNPHTVHLYDKIKNFITTIVENKIITDKIKIVEFHNSSYTYNIETGLGTRKIQILYTDNVQTFKFLENNTLMFSITLTKLNYKIDIVTNCESHYIMSYEEILNCIVEIGSIVFEGRMNYEQAEKVHSTYLLTL